MQCACLTQRQQTVEHCYDMLTGPLAGHVADLIAGHVSLPGQAAPVSEHAVGPHSVRDATANVCRQLTSVCRQLDVVCQHADDR